MVTGGQVAEGTLADRYDGRGVRAQHIGVSDRTINNAEGDKRAVRRITLNAWAHATGVSLEWLQNGVTTPSPPDPTRQADKLARLTEQKRSRATRSRPTRQYLPAFAGAACAA